MSKFDEQESFLQQIACMSHYDIVFYPETQRLYKNALPSMHMRYPDNHQPLEGRDLFDGSVKHYSFSTLANILDLNKSNSAQFCRFFYGNFYKAELEYHGNKIPVIIKNWQLSYPSRYSCQLFPAMLYNDICITRQKQPNVAKLIGYSIDKLLVAVYDSDPICTLTEAMFGTSEFASQFGWESRLEAAIDVGRVTKSFHEHGSIVGSIDADYMLVDKDFKVHLCDFRIQNDLVEMVSHNLDEVFHLPYEGYGRDAPESGLYEIDGCSYTRKNIYDAPTLERDTYSYGILLLDLVSKQKISNMCYHQWTKDMVPPEKLSNFVHESFLPVEDPRAKEITSIAVSCLSVDPSNRPKIGDVLNSLSSFLPNRDLGHRDKIRKL